MNNLEEIRLKINKIDENMASLFEERMMLSKEIAKYKIANKLPIFDSIREEENIKRNVNYINNPDLRNYYIEFLTKTMDISKEYQTFLLELMQDLHTNTLH